MYCIYNRRTLDGMMAAAVVLKYATEENFDHIVDFVPWSVGKETPDLEMGRRVVMCGTPFTLEQMYYFYNITNGSVVLADYHPEPIHDFVFNDGPAYCKSLFPNVRTLKGGNKPSLAIGKEGSCELIWKYYYPTCPIPEIVSLLGAYDSGRLLRNSKLFQLGARAYLTGFRECYDALNTFDRFVGTVGRWIDDGKLIREYLRNVKTLEA